MFLPPFFFSFCVRTSLPLRPCPPLSLFFSDESIEGTPVIPPTKQEEEVAIMRSWVKVGGFPTWPEEEAKTVMMEVSPPSCVYHPSA